MFSALSQGSLIHILDKTNGLKYKVGEVIGVTQPNGLGGMFSNNFNNPAVPITLKVKIEGEVRDYPDIPSSNNTMSYNNGKIIICETKQGIQLEVENKFLLGDYKLQTLKNHGQHFTVNFTLNGKRDRAKERFNCHVGCVAWPFGNIKIATPLIKD